MPLSSPSGALGQYLRARRELVTPADVGLPVIGVRRVTGLRREEVAMLAGISADYYLRLEQGRDRNPSGQVLAAIAGVLGLDSAAKAHLTALVVAPHHTAQKRPRREVVPEGAAALLQVIGVPAFIEGRFFDVLSANTLAEALSPNLSAGLNRLRSFFLDPAERDLYPDWEAACAMMVAGFRESVGSRADDPRAVALVGQLSLASDRFARLWARHDVVAREGAPARMDHPVIGPVVLRREKLAISGTDGLIFVVYHPEAGSDSAQRLARLASSSLHADDTESG